MSLLQTLHLELQKKKALSFPEYMNLVLYAPGEGYYSAGLPKIGAQGDFITAPELTPLFGKSLANQCQQIFAVIDSHRV